MRERHTDGRPDLSVDPGVANRAAAAAGRKGVQPRDRWDIVLVIAAGGAVGSLGRWALTEVVPQAPWHVPWGTWVVNVSGAYALGVLMVFVLDVWPPRRYVRPFLGVGVLGGYTTFSTYMLDTRTLLADGHEAAAVGYLFGTLLTGLFAVAAGVLAARAVVHAGERRRRAPRATEREADVGPER